MQVYLTLQNVIGLAVVVVGLLGVGALFAISYVDRLLNNGGPLVIRGAPDIPAKPPAAVGSLAQPYIHQIQVTGKCLFCGNMLAVGPEGGMSVNLICDNPECGCRYNIGMSGLPFGEITIAPKVPA